MKGKDKSRGGENGQNFLKFSMGKKNYLTDIQFTDGGKGKKKAELFDLC